MLRRKIIIDVIQTHTKDRLARMLYSSFKKYTVYVSVHQNEYRQTPLLARRGGGGHRRTVLTVSQCFRVPSFSPPRAGRIVLLREFLIPSFRIVN